MPFLEMDNETNFSWVCALKLDADATPNPRQVQVELTACCFRSAIVRVVGEKVLVMLQPSCDTPYISGTLAD